MSYISLNSPSAKSLKEITPPATDSLRSAFSRWLLLNHGAKYRAEVKRQRERPNAENLKADILSGNRAETGPVVGIVGGGFAGLYAGLILQSLGIECEIFENSDRVGGRIYTWYSADYSPNDVQKSGLYGEVGGMRLPQYSADMLPVQQLALSVNSVLKRNGMDDNMVYWRKFYYDSPVQRLRFNNMPAAITLKESALNSLNFDAANGGDIPQVWFEEKIDSGGNKYLPVNQVLEMVNTPFIDAINRSFAEGFTLMMQYDQHSMWDYLTNVFTLGDMGQYYDPRMGAKGDFLPWSVASFLETTNVGSGMYGVSFVEMVIAVYDWGGSKNPYKPNDNSICMLTVNEGIQHFPDACRKVLDLDTGVTEDDGWLAQMQVGMVPDENGKYSYTAPNLTPDAEPNGSDSTAENSASNDISASSETKESAFDKQRVFLEHKVIQMKYEPQLYDNHGGMKLVIKNQSDSELIEKRYPYVITTLPSGAYLNGDLRDNLMNDISFDKAQAIREVNYMSAFKAFLTFKTQFWAKLGERQGKGLGAASTDRPNRQIIYPSYGYEAEGGVLQVYCWAQDADRLGALSDEERINECLKGIAYLYPDGDVYENFAGYDDGKTTKTWFWDSFSGGGAFALYAPEQFKNIYPTLLTPEFDGCLNFAGESCSVHHGWIVGALDSAYNAVYHILQHAGAEEKIEQMQKTWGQFAPPDIAADGTANDLDYAYIYNEVDRKASSIAPGAKESIYGDSQYEFKGNVPAFVANYEKVPETMKKTIQDQNVLDMLNAQWDDNVAQRARVQSASEGKSDNEPDNSETAVQMLERIYYGNNFQTIPKPLFWLKDDDEFARQQLAGFMPNLLTKISTEQELMKIIERAKIDNPEAMPLRKIQYVANYRRYLEACTVTPVDYYLAKPIVFFEVTDENELMPVGIQLETGGELFTPTMANAENAWLLAKMQTNGAGQSLHDVGFHQLYTHQICAMVSIALFSEEVFNPLTSPASEIPFQEHPVFKLLRPHVVKALEFQQTIYNRDYNPYAESFPATRTVNGQPGVYNLGFVYDLIFSCGRIGNYQLQDRMYNKDGKFRFLDMAIPKDAAKRGVEDTPFSYAYVHDAWLWYRAMQRFVFEFVGVAYNSDEEIAGDVQLQRFFSKLIPAFNHKEDSHESAQRFPEEVKTGETLAEVLTMLIWQFSVQHTVVNDGAYNHAAFVPNASTLMLPLPEKPSADWTPADVLACLPSQTATYPELGNMNFMDVQINASVTGQGPYPETIFGRGVLEPSIDFLQDTYGFTDAKLRLVVDDFYQLAREVGHLIRQRQNRDVAKYLALHPQSENVPETVTFDLLSPVNVMNTIQT